MFWTNYRPTAICLLFLFTVGPLAASEDWNQWRGPRRDGSAVGVRWTNDPNDLQSVWKVRAGKGYSGPLIIGDRILVAETLDTKTAGLRALSITDGSQLWAQHWPSSGSVPFFAAANGDWIRATPVSDGELVVVGDMRETLRAFSVDTGKLVWSVDLPTRFGTAIPDFGFASSPVIEGERLFVQGPTPSSPSICVQEPRSGAPSKPMETCRTAAPSRRRSLPRSPDDSRYWRRHATPSTVSIRRPARSCGPRISTTFAA